MNRIEHGLEHFIVQNLPDTLTKDQYDAYRNQSTGQDTSPVNNTEPGTYEPHVEKAPKCLNEPPEVFFPKVPSRTTTQKAIAICNQCVLIEECLEEDLNHGVLLDINGVRGGLSQGARRKLFRQRSKEKKS